MSLARLGALADFWDGRPEHLPLLGLQPPDVERVIRRLREIGERAPSIREDIQAALMDGDWRPQLVGAVCVALGMGDARHVDTIWEAALHGSWVTPQLLVVASLVDPDFRVRARSAVELILGTDDAGALPKAAASVWSAQLHSSQGPSGSAGRRGKALAAIVALLDPAEEPWVCERMSDPRSLAILKADVDGGGKIALRWRERFMAYR